MRSGHVLPLLNRYGHVMVMLSLCYLKSFWLGLNSQPFKKNQKNKVEGKNELSFAEQSTMEQAFANFLASVKLFCPKVTDEELVYLKSGLTLTELKPKHMYIHAEAIQHEIGFVHEGLLRSFYVDPQGNEITVNFIRENRYATHYTAFITRTPSKYHFQCIEHSVIVNLSYGHIQRGYDLYPTIERYGRLVAEEILKFQQKRIEAFLFDTAETRYLDFIKTNPDLFNRVSLSHLSSFLGMERQTLTRIRQKLAKNGV